jgi:hypothetical protein
MQSNISMLGQDVPSQSWCASMNDGFFSDPVTQNCYYRCISTVAFHMCCAAGLVWKQLTSSCAFS